MVASLRELLCDCHCDVILALILLPGLPRNHRLEIVNLLHWRHTSGNADLARILGAHQARLFPTLLLLAGALAD